MSTQDAIDREWQQREEDAEDNFVYCCECGEELRERVWPDDFTGRHADDYLTEKCEDCACPPEEDPDEWMERCEMFQDPGGNSALRRETRSNPRNLPCPTCGAANRLTPADVALGYQCDACADRCERGGY